MKINEKFDAIEAQELNVIEQLIKLANSTFVHYVIIQNFPATTHSHIIEQKDPWDLTVIYAGESSIKIESDFMLNVKNISDGIFLTTFTLIERKANYTIPSLIQLLDSRLIYASDKKFEIEFQILRQKAEQKLKAPLSKKELKNIYDLYLKENESLLIKFMIEKDPAVLLGYTWEVIYNALNALKMLNHDYWHSNICDLQNEIKNLSKKPKDILSLLDSAISYEDTKTNLQVLLELHSQIMKIYEECLKESAIIFKSKQNHDVRNSINIFLNVCSYARKRISIAIKEQEKKWILFTVLYDCYSSLDKYIQNPNEMMRLWSPDPKVWPKIKEDFDKLMQNYYDKLKNELTTSIKAPTLLNKYEKLYDLLDDLDNYNFTVF